MSKQEEMVSFQILVVLTTDEGGGFVAECPAIAGCL